MAVEQVRAQGDYALIYNEKTQRHEPLTREVTPLELIQKWHLITTQNSGAQGAPPPRFEYLVGALSGPVDSEYLVQGLAQAGLLEREKENLNSIIEETSFYSEELEKMNQSFRLKKIDYQLEKITERLRRIDVELERRATPQPAL
jgi:hypothetical protein